MDKALKSIINKTIEREYDQVCENFENALRKNPEIQKKVEDNSNVREELRQKLLKILPKEYEDILNNFEDACNIQNFIESKVMFKEGVILGLTELSYLDEVGLEIALI